MEKEINPTHDIKLFAGRSNPKLAQEVAEALGTSIGPMVIKDFADGFKGFEVGANYTLAKNIVAGVKYYDLEAREGEAKDVRTLWSEVVFTF